MRRPNLSVDTALCTALRADARGIYPTEAGIELLIDHDHFLRRGDFIDHFIDTATSITDGITPMATIDWPAAINALDTGRLPCSGGQQRILRLTASLIHGIPVNLHTTLTGLDHHVTRLVINAIQHTSGQRPNHTNHDQ